METGVYGTCLFLVLLVSSSSCLEPLCMSCNCDGYDSPTTLCDIDERVTHMEMNMIAVNSKIEEWVRQQYVIRDLKMQLYLYEVQMEQVLTELSKLRQPRPSALTFVDDKARQQNNGSLNSETTTQLVKDVANLSEKVEAIENQVNKNISVEVMELQEDFQGEKRVTRSIRQNLDDTMQQLHKLGNESIEVKIEERLKDFEESWEIKLRDWESFNVSRLDEQLKTFEYHVVQNANENLRQEIKDLEHDISEQKSMVNNALDQHEDLVNNLLIEIKRLNASVVYQNEHMNSTDKILTETISNMKLLSSLVEHQENSIKELANNSEILFSNLLSSVVGLDSAMFDAKHNITFLDQEIQKGNSNLTEAIDDVAQTVASLKSRSSEIEAKVSHQIVQNNKSYALLQEFMNTTVDELLHLKDRTTSTLEEEISKLNRSIKGLKKHADENKELLKADVLDLRNIIRKELRQLKLQMMALETNANNNIRDNMKRIEKEIERIHKNIKTLEEAFKTTVENLSKDNVRSNLTDEEENNHLPAAKNVTGYPQPTSMDVEEEYIIDTDTDSAWCITPVLQDKELLIYVDVGPKLEILRSSEQHALVSGSVVTFGCQEIGQYVLMDNDTKEPAHEEFSLTCIDGIWHGGEFPTCVNLMDETENRIYSSIPVIKIDPDRLNRPMSLLATGPRGTLVVYPGTSFSLNCFYPRNVPGDRFGTLTWYVNGSLIPTAENMSSPPGLSLTFTDISVSESGTYSCAGYEERKHNIRLVVKAVSCDYFHVPPGNPLNVHYKPHPDIGAPIMTTMALFSCPDEYDLPMVSNATCSGHGHWTTPAPNCLVEQTKLHAAENSSIDDSMNRTSKNTTSAQLSDRNLDGNLRTEVHPAKGNVHGKRSTDDLNDTPASDGCFLDITDIHGLRIAPEKGGHYDIGDIVTFECDEGLELTGTLVTHCTGHQTWSHEELPRCLSK